MSPARKPRSKPRKPVLFAFTQTRLAKLKPPAKGRDTYSDTEVPGLQLRITATGTMTYSVWRRPKGGQPVRYTIGDAKAMTIQEARDEAKARLGEYARGVNPNEQQRQQKREQAKKSATFKELWAYYLENHAKPHKKSWKVDEQRHDRHLTAWAGKKLADISAADVERLHKQIGKKSGHYEANRLLALLRKVFSMSDKLGYDGPNPTKGVEMFNEESRERFLAADEMPTFFEALETLRSESPVAADAIEVALWTGARRGNVLSMRWEELSLQTATWTVPGEKSKNGKPIIVHLPAPALAILQCRQEAAGASPWVFPGRRLGKPLTDPYKPWAKLLEASGLKDLRPHDLRRTMGSWQTATGANLQVVGKTLGHADLSSTQVYARLNLEPVREAVNKAVAAMEAAKDAGKPVKVASVTVTPADGQKKIGLLGN